MPWPRGALSGPGPPGSPRDRQPLLPVPAHEPRDAVLDRGAGHEAGVPGQVLDIGEGGRDVARLDRQQLLDGRYNKFRQMAQFYTE